MGCASLVIEVEYHSLALAQHAEDRSLKGDGRQVELGEVDVGHQYTVFGDWVI